MEQLLQDIVNLEEQETAFLAQLTMAETEEEERAFTNELNIVRNKLSERKEELRLLQEKEQQRAEVIETKVQEEGIPFAIAGVDFSGLDQAVITLIDLVVRADRRRLLNEHAVELELAEHEHKQYEANMQARLDGYEHQEKALKEIIERGTDENKRLIQENGDLRDHSYKQNTEIEDLRTKLANASAQLEEKDAEIARLNSQIEDYQRAKVFGERQAQQIIDVTPQENSDISAALEAVKQLYTKRENWGPVDKVFLPDGTYKVIPRAEVDAEWEKVEVPQFRNEDTETVAEDNQFSHPEAPTLVTEDTFLGSTEQRGDNQDVNGSNVGAAQQEATLEARVAKLEAAVFGWQAVA